MTFITINQIKSVFAVDSGALFCTISECGSYDISIISHEYNEKFTVRIFDRAARKSYGYTVTEHTAIEVGDAQLEIAAVKALALALVENKQ